MSIKCVMFRLPASFVLRVTQFHRSGPLPSVDVIRLHIQRSSSSASVTHGSTDGNGSSLFVKDRIRDYQEERWERNLNELQDKLSSGASIVEPYLKRWIARQRTEYNKRMKGSETSLHDSRLKKLLPIEKEYQIFQFERNIWEEKYKELLKFIEDNDGLFPYEFDEEDLSPEHASLLEWCGRQRHLYHNHEKYGKVHGFSAARLKLLDKIGFSWSITDFRWTKKYDELVEYFKQHGNSMVPNYYAPNPGLARWVRLQREKQNTAERRKLLEAVDFVWDPCEYRWMLKYYALKDLTANYGKGRVPGIQNKTYSMLNRWLSYQKVCYEKYLKGEASSMTERRKQLLQELGFNLTMERKVAPLKHVLKHRLDSNTLQCEVNTDAQ